MECSSTCEGPECLSDCNRESIACTDSCPCHTDCIAGCEGCGNPICVCNGDNEFQQENLNACISQNEKFLGDCILKCNSDAECKNDCVTQFENNYSECPCQEKCPYGCPCDGYDCEISQKKSVLVLYTRENSNQPVLIKADGGVTENFEFEIGEESEVWESCSAMLNGNMYIFGGHRNKDVGYKRNQISKVRNSSCKLKRLGSLDYDFRWGACGTFKFPENSDQKAKNERVLLCFADKSEKFCESYDGNNFFNHTNSIFGHRKTSLANYNGSPMAVGGYSKSNKTEIYDISTDTWTEAAEYPYHDFIYYYATVTTPLGVLILGGYGADGDEQGIAKSTVACFNNSKWSKLDGLQSPRHAHRAIVNEEKVFVVGGSNYQHTEIWSLDGESYNIKLAQPKLMEYFYYPELFVVDADYCVTK